MEVDVRQWLPNCRVIYSRHVGSHREGENDQNHGAEDSGTAYSANNGVSVARVSPQADSVVENSRYSKRSVTRFFRDGNGAIETTDGPHWSQETENEGESGWPPSEICPPTKRELGSVELGSTSDW